jgi:hypothetical protein
MPCQTLPRAAALGNCPISVLLAKGRDENLTLVAKVLPKRVPPPSSNGGEALVDDASGQVFDS